jgi:dTMP kinase
MYLSGEFGEDPKAVNAYVASTFYAADRFATFKKDYEEYYKNGGIILADRYTTANMVHQAGKIKDEEERTKFIDWLFNLEFGIYNLPVPTKVFFLNMPTETAQELMKNRENKFTHDTKKDIHERDEAHLKDAYNAACSLATKYGWCEIKCVEDGRLKTREEIHGEILNVVEKVLSEVNE